MKYNKQLKFVTFCLFTNLCLINYSIVKAADQTISTPTTSQILLSTNGDDLTVTSAGSITYGTNDTGAVKINSTNTTGSITNYGTIDSSIAAAYTIRNQGGILSITNYGTIAHSSNLDISSTYATIRNESSGVAGIISNLVNEGVISSAGNLAIISTGSGTSITNLNNSGTISARRRALYFSSSNSGSITNSGTISAGLNSALDFSNSNIGSITNSGTISAGTTYGINNSNSSTSVSTIASITNSGTISAGTSYGINNSNNGSAGSTITSITNSGTISAGTSYGIFNQTSGTGGATISSITNTGTISSNTSAIENFSYSSSGIATITEITNSGIISAQSNTIKNYKTSGTGNSLIDKITNSGSITATTGSAIYNHSTNTGGSGTAKISNLINTGTIKSTSGIGIENLANAEITNLTNSGIISGSTYSISNAGTLGTVNLNEGSVLIGPINSSTSYNLVINVGASKSYAFSTSGVGAITLSDLDNRPQVSGSAYAINIGSMEMASENLYQKTSNIIDAVDRNLNKNSYIEPYYTEANRNSLGDSSEVRNFKNNRQGVNAGFNLENTNTQFLLNIEQSKINIDTDEHIINSDGFIIGLVNSKYAKTNDFDVSLKALAGYSNSKTDRRILDNTSSTGSRVLTGEYDSFYGVLGTSLSKNYIHDQNLKSNLLIGLDLSSEFRSSFNESLYYKYSGLSLIQLQPKISTEITKTFDKDSNIFLIVGAEGREIISGRNQNYQMNNTNVSYQTTNPSDIYGVLSLGSNINLSDNLKLYAVATARLSDQNTESYNGSFGLKGSF